MQPSGKFFEIHWNKQTSKQTKQKQNNFLQVDPFEFRFSATFLVYDSERGCLRFAIIIKKMLRVGLKSDVK